jgi:hypothetical protein
MTDTEKTTVSFEDHSKVVQDLQHETEKRQRFEAQLVDLQKKLAPFEKVDLAALKAKAEELDLVKQQSAKTPEDVKALIEAERARVRQEAQDEINQYKTNLDKLTGENKELKVVDRVMAEIGGDFTKDSQVFVKQYVRSAIDINPQTGEYIVKDEKGEPRYSKTDRTKLMSVKEYAAEIASKHPSIAVPTKTSGGMSAGEKTNGTASDLSTDQWLGMTPAQRATYPMDIQRKMGVAAVKAFRQ